MRYSASEKFEIIRLVEQSSLSVGQTLLRLSIRRSIFYGWLKRHQQDGIDGLKDRKPSLDGYGINSPKTIRLQLNLDYSVTTAPVIFQVS